MVRDKLSISAICKLRMVKLKPILLQDVIEGNSTCCGTLCVDHTGSDLASRVANKVYNGSRDGKLRLSGFPDYAPLLQALKTGGASKREKSFRVTIQQQDHLLVLESFAQKWLADESTKERALEIIDQHNQEYNKDGGYWASDRRTPR